MTSEEICIMFKQAKNKRKEIDVLADLTASDAETIAEILRGAGLYVERARCTRCGKEFGRLIVPHCAECENKLARRRMDKARRARWALWQVEQNEQRIASLRRQIALIQAESKKLMEVIG
jgi:predicted Zn-ribbon and HTH transcriptional regulator